MFHQKPSKTPPSKRPATTRRKRFSSRTQRSGAAVVEAAICFPLIIILMLGTLEISAGLYLRESLSVCCFEACRVGTVRRATADDVQARAIEVLADRGVTGASVVLTPSNYDSLNSLDTFSVQITAPTAGNSIFIFDNLVNRSIQSNVTMVREFDE